MHSVQKNIDIAEIKDDCVVLKDGSMVGVVMISSINFDLKSEEEQNAIIVGYVNFLNTVEWPLQIVIQSRKLNIDTYLAKMDQMAKAQTNELLKMQTEDYIQYIKELIQLGDIMSKRFYVVVKYSVFLKRKGFWARFLESLRADISILAISEQTFMQYKKELGGRLGQVVSGLQSLGLTCVVLDTQNLIDLYRNTYNIESVDNYQQVVDVEKLQIEK